jgi:arylsulfatase A-like enzyme
MAAERHLALFHRPLPHAHFRHNRRAEQQPAGRRPPGGASNALVEEIDVLPTILELLEIPAPEGIQGKSLLPVARGGPGKPAVFAEFPAIHAVRTAEWKLVHYLRSQRGEFYNLKNDPHELNNLWENPGYLKRRGEVQGLLFDWHLTSQDPLLAPVKDE